MSLGLYDYDRRYRRRVWTGFVKFLLFIALLLAIGLFTYQIGVEQFKGRDASLREDVSHLSRQKGELELLAQQLKQAQVSAETRAAELEARLATDVPHGDLARLMQLVSERLAEGVGIERLAFVIAAVQNKRDCQSPETKRFVLSTPIYKSPNRAISFAGGTITVTGEGASMRDANGDSEAWYDPAQPVSLRITAQGGKDYPVQGVLPLHHSIVIGNSEYRFTVVAGSRSFAEVTADRCSFP
ncbi:MAG: hypothetical protein GC191_00050 [Azospirillum sp.]|nr:hypothetical protein [Azospirillum sp.]